MPESPAMPRVRIVPIATTVAALLSLVLAACQEAGAPTGVQDQVVPTPEIQPGPASDPTILATGDAVCGVDSELTNPCRHADVATLITSLNPSAVLLLGDNQYENGSLADYNTYYDASWGIFKAITWPSAGNHEYGTAGASGYFDYFNGVGAATGRAGDRSKGYYSFMLGAWHVVALNSNCSEIGGCHAGSAQEQWLRADLAASSASCTLAFWHHPLFSSGSHGNNPKIQPLWQALYDFEADLVLSAHDHDYERFAPQTASGAAAPGRGIRSFVVGTGGKRVTPFQTIVANSELRDNSAFGVLQLTLGATSFDWQFVATAGNSFTDSGLSLIHI